MRRTALIVAPVFALTLVGGCDQGGDGGSGGNLESCVTGEWTSDAEALAAMGMDTDAFGSLEETIGSDMVWDIGLNFDKDGKFDWNFGVSTDGTVQGTSFSIDVDMSILGTWEITKSDDIVLAVTDTEATSTTTVNGKETTQDMPDQMGELTDSDSGPMKVTCSTSTMTITRDGSTKMTLTRK